ncbi:phosphoribosylglycinamide formyltransferase [Verrucomicrobium sp. BvORR106]|uniref:phosphoribosylglycinamide formyltransferase n=1 Tax=Verrucomicrobium sp. BvORR106 TaxID=1403819 RepID=UPI000AC27214|nr:phosphoribosylglycinamide formyltransferase [Verrucomicrobium sp. BvORR106]
MTDPLQDFEPETWLCTVDQVREFRAQLEALGQKLVFTNGCFDLLHAGHVRYLRQARALGDALVVALNSDSSVRELKGPSRPVNTEEDRAEILMGLESVNAVVKFDDPRVTKLIEAIAPHVYAKGGDYTVETLNPEEKAALDKVGADIQILPLVPGRSTTATLKRAKEGELAVAAAVQGGAPAGTVVTGGAVALPVNPASESGPLRIGILGSGHGSNFEAIHRAIAEGHLEADIRVVISDHAESRILRKAREAGLNTIHVDAGGAGWKLPASAQKEICDHLKRHDVQVVVLAGFMRVLKEPLLSEFADRIVNVHPSLLPKYKGKEAWVQALEEGELETGATVHLVNAEIDGGRILAQGAVPIHIGDTADAVLERIHTVEHQIYPQVLADWRKLGLRTS